MLGSEPGHRHQTVLIVTVFFSSVHLQIKECWLHLRMSLIKLYKWLILLNLYSSSHYKMGHMQKAVFLPKEVGHGLEVKCCVIVGVVSWTSCFVQGPWCVFERTTDRHTMIIQAWPLADISLRMDEVSLSLQGKNWQQNTFAVNWKIWAFKQIIRILENLYELDSFQYLKTSLMIPLVILMNVVVVML